MPKPERTNEIPLRPRGFDPSYRRLQSLLRDRVLRQELLKVNEPGSETFARKDQAINHPTD